MKGVGPNRSAFSLVEVVIVLAIMAVLAAIAAPRYSATLANYRVLLAARRLAADVGLAQSSARAASASRTIVFDTSKNSYTVSGVAALDGASGAYTVFLAAQPYGVTIGSLTFSDNIADGTLKFDGFGSPDSGATIVIAFKTYQRTVLVNAATGAATVQ